MGSFQSSLTEQTLKNFNSVMSSQIAAIYNQSTLTCTAANVLDITSCPPLPGGQPGLVIRNSVIRGDQKASSTCSFTSENDNKISATFQADVTNIIKSFIDTELQSEQGWFATAFSLQIDGAKTSTEVANLISSSFQGDIRNICGAQVQAYNIGKVLLCGYYEGSTFNFNQDAMVMALTSCINRNVISVFSTNSILNNLWIETDKKLASKQEGLGGILLYLIIAGVVIAVIVVIGLIIWLVISRGSGGSKVVVPIPAAPTIQAGVSLGV